jgi:hypothetical protein
MQRCATLRRLTTALTPPYTDAVTDYYEPDFPDDVERLDRMSEMDTDLRLLELWQLVSEAEALDDVGRDLLGLCIRLAYDAGYNDGSRGDEPCAVKRWWSSVAPRPRPRLTAVKKAPPGVASSGGVSTRSTARIGTRSSAISKYR